MSGRDPCHVVVAGNHPTGASAPRLYERPRRWNSPCAPAATGHRTTTSGRRSGSICSAPRSDRGREAPKWQVERCSHWTVTPRPGRYGEVASPFAGRDPDRTSVAESFSAPTRCRSRATPETGSRTSIVTAADFRVRIVIVGRRNRWRGAVPRLGAPAALGVVRLHRSR